MNKLIKKYNLPKYVKGKSFAEASKLIQKKFGDRTDPDSLQTRDEILSRLRDAQEEIKFNMEAGNQPPAQLDPMSMPSPSQNKYFIGGSAQAIAGAAEAGATASKAAGAAAKAAKVAKGVETASNVANTASELPGGLGSFLPMDVDDSGDTLPDVPSVGSSALNAGMAGASLGANFGPVGAGIGAVVGGVAGAISGTINKKKAADAAETYMMKQSRNEVDMSQEEIDESKSVDPNIKDDLGMGQSNAFKKGGKVNEYEHGGPHKPEDRLTNFLKNYNSERGIQLPLKNNIPTYEVPYAMEGDPRLALEDNETPIIGETEIKKSKEVGNEDVDSEVINEDVDAIEAGSNFRANNFINKYKEPMFKSGTKESSSENKGEKENEEEEEEDPKSPLASYLRYAPVASNAAQLLSMKRPEKESLTKSNNRYTKRYTDQARLENIVRDANASNRSAILNSSQGSGSAARASLIANNASSTRALSDASARAAEYNQNEDRRAEAYHNQVKDYNNQLQDRENIINLQNEASYDNQKSNLIAGLSNNLSGVGKEELMKQYPGLMGMDYGYLGKFLNKQNKNKNKKTDG